MSRSYYQPVLRGFNVDQVITADRQSVTDYCLACCRDRARRIPRFAGRPDRAQAHVQRVHGKIPDQLDVLRPARRDDPRMLYCRATSVLRSLYHSFECQLVQRRNPRTGALSQFGTVIVRETCHPLTFRVLIDTFDWPIRYVICCANSGNALMDLFSGTWHRVVSMSSL